MANYVKKNYEPPAFVQNALKGADEAGDLRFLHSSAAVIRIGEVPVGAVENWTITSNTTRNPIMTCSSPVPIGFDFGGNTVTISGQIVLNAASGLNDSGFFPNSVAELISSINEVFDVDIIAFDATAESPEDQATEPIVTVKNCQNTGETITLNSNTNLRQAITAVGTFMERNIKTALQNFNKI